MLQAVSTGAYYHPNFATGASYLTTGTLCIAASVFELRLIKNMMLLMMMLMMVMMLMMLMMVYFEET